MLKWGGGNMKRKTNTLCAAVAIGLASALMLTGCGKLTDYVDQQAGPVNQRYEEEKEEDEAGGNTVTELVISDTDADNSEVNAETSEAEVEPEGSGDVTGESEDVTSVSDAVQEELPDTVELSFDPADRPNANEATGSVKVLEPGDIAPDFTVALTNGEDFTLSDHDGGMVLINFWATWCGPCVGEMPELGQLAEDGIENFDIVCVNCGEDKSTVDSFVNDMGYTFNIAYDTDYTVSEYYPTDYIPYSIIVKNGVVCETYVGAPPDAYESYKNEVLRFMDQ